MYEERNFKTPRSLRDLFILSLMCLEKVNFESRVKLRCLCSLTLSTIVPLKKRGGRVTLIFF